VNVFYSLAVCRQQLNFFACYAHYSELTFWWLIFCAISVGTFCQVARKKGKITRNNMKCFVSILRELFKSNVFRKFLNERPPYFSVYFSNLWSYKQENHKKSAYSKHAVKYVWLFLLLNPTQKCIWLHERQLQMVKEYTQGPKVYVHSSM
jgi:hypothetical protein